jgi:outer membrane protein
VKNVSILLNVVLLIAVGVLYFLHFSSRPATAAEGTVTQSSTTGQDTISVTDASQRIVYVNTDTLLTHYEYFKTSKSAMEAKSKKLEGEIASRTRNLENEYMAAQQKAQSGSLTQDQMMNLEQQFMKKQQDFVQYRDTQARKLMEEEQKINEELNKNISDFLKGYGQEKGYQVVLGYTLGNSSVLFGSNNLDITRDVLEGLNREYTASLAPKK